MPVTLTVDRQNRVVYSAFLGEVTEQELLTHSDKIRSHPHFDPSFSEIVDFSGVTDVAISEQIVSSMANRPSIFRKESKHVLVAPPGLISRLARKYKDLAEETRPNLTVVRTVAEAYENLRQDSTGDAKA